MILGNSILGATVLGSGSAADSLGFAPSAVVTVVTYGGTTETQGEYSGGATGLDPVAVTGGAASGFTNVLFSFSPAVINLVAQNYSYQINSNTYTTFSPAILNIVAQPLASNSYSVAVTAFTPAIINLIAQDMQKIATDNKIISTAPASIGFASHTYSTRIVESFISEFSPAIINLSGLDYSFSVPTKINGSFLPAEINLGGVVARHSTFILGNPKYIFELKTTVKVGEYEV